MILFFELMDISSVIMESLLHQYTELICSILVSKHVQLRSFVVVRSHVSLFIWFYARDIGCSACVQFGCVIKWGLQNYWSRLQFRGH